MTPAEVVNNARMTPATVLNSARWPRRLGVYSSLKIIIVIYCPTVNSKKALFGFHMLKFNSHHINVAANA
jgi:hypothetical protein